MPPELFPLDPTEGWSPPDDPPERRWRDEWESLGFVCGPPLFSLFARGGAAPVRGVPLIRSTDVPRHVGRLVRVQGLVATSRNVWSEDGRPVQFVTLHDDHGLTEVTLFADCPQTPYLTLGPYVALGVVEDRFGAVTLTARRFERIGAS